MSDLSNCGESAGSEEWGTPQELFDELDEEFHFGIDAAASAENYKCPYYFTKEQDALKQEWSPDWAEGLSVFCNPPYNHESLTGFTEKAMIEALLNNVTTVFLVPCKTEQAWWHRIWNAHERGMLDIEYRWCKGRVKYQGASSGARFASVVIIIRPRTLP